MVLPVVVAGAGLFDAAAVGENGQVRWSAETGVDGIDDAVTVGVLVAEVAEAVAIRIGLSAQSSSLLLSSLLLSSLLSSSSVLPPSHGPNVSPCPTCLSTALTETASVFLPL